MNHFERRLWRWAWRMRVRMDRRRGDLFPAPFSPRPQDADVQACYALSILCGTGESNSRACADVGDPQFAAKQGGCLVSKPGLISELRISSLS